jgi:hypothetical protein
MSTKIVKNLEFDEVYIKKKKGRKKFIESLLNIVFNTLNLKYQSLLV